MTWPQPYSNWFTSISNNYVKLYAWSVRGERQSADGVNCGPQLHGVITYVTYKPTYVHAPPVSRQAIIEDTSETSNLSSQSLSAWKMSAAKITDGPESSPAVPLEPSPITYEKYTKPDSVHKDGVDTESAQPHAEAGDIELERRVVRKLDLHVVPLVFALFLLSFLDRSNIGNAEIAGMKEDLDLDAGRYNWLLTIFYIVCDQLHISPLCRHLLTSTRVISFLNLRF